MNTDTDPDGLSLDGYREYLIMLARLHWDERLAGKMDASDIVQQTLLEAWKARHQVQGSTEPEVRAWLRKVLSNNLIDAVRKWTGQARDARREQSIEEALEKSATRMEDWLAAEQSSPSQRAERNEQLLRLSEALAMLPKRQRTAIELRDLKGWSLKVICEFMGTTESAVGGLLRHGRNRLSELLADEDGDE